MESEKIPVNASGREYRKKRVEELGSALAQIRARVKATRGSNQRKDEEVEQSGGSKTSEDTTERTALTKKILEEDRARFTKLQQNRVRMKEEYDQILIEREEQKKVEKQLQETIAKVTAPSPELPPLIKQRIIDLETNVETLKERLSEKDKVLSSKTQALTVLHNQLMQRSQEQVEKAMAFTQEISTIKEDFSKREEHLKKEINRLKEREEELELRLADKETHTNEIESLQLELEEVRKELRETVIKNEESAKTLESTNKINLKLKAQLKAMKMERDKLKQAQEGIEDIEELKNRIALLEEEKGNLQLQLVDFDEFKESFAKVESKATLLEEELHSLRENFKALQEEKITLQSNLESSNNQIKEQADLIEKLRTSLKEIEEQKISAEMRSIEIEEKMEDLQNKMSLQFDKFRSEITSLESQIGEKNSIIESLSNQLSLKEQEIFDIKGNNFPAEVETESRLREIESYNSELVEKVRELQLKCEGHEKVVIQLNEALSEKNETINNLKLKCDELKTTVIDLNNNKTALENKIQLLKSSEEASKREHQPKENQESKDDVNLKFKKLAANYKIKNKLCQELEEKYNASSTALEEKNNEIIKLTSQLNELNLEAQELRNREETIHIELENVKAKNQQLLRIVEELGPKLEAMEAEKSSAQLKAEQMNRALEELKEWKEGDSKLLKEHVSSVNSMASNVSLLEQELTNLQSIVNEKNHVIGELEAERKKLVEDMRNSEFELERLRSLYQKESVRNQNVLTNLEGLESEMLVSREEMNQIAEQLESVTKNYNICLANLQERENYIEALEQDIVGMKTKMYNLESGIGDRHRLLEERGNQLSARLEEAEILTQTFDRYQAEMDKKFKMMEENESTMKSNLLELQSKIEKLSKLNQELRNKNESSEKQVAEMTEEISSLKEVKNSYNKTLDTIELLNEELKQVMEDFEAKNQELIRLGEERADIFNKLTDLEDAYADLRSQLDESEETTTKLKSELEIKANALENALLEVKSLRNEIEEYRTQSPDDIKPPLSIPQEVKVFSWDQHSHAPDDSFIAPVPLESNSIKFELEEKRKQLQDSEQEIYNLQLQISSLLSNKDSEIANLKEEITRLSNECSNLRNSLTFHPTNPTESTLSVFSWDQHQGAGDKFDAVKEELNECKKKLEIAEHEINNLKSSMNSILSNHEVELTDLRNEIQRISLEKNELEKTLTSQNNLNTERNEIQMFSWGEHDQSTNQSNNDIKHELEEKTKLLELAQQEITNIQVTLNTKLNEKVSEIAVLKEEINRLLNQKADLEKLMKTEINIHDNRSDEVKMFSWGQLNQDSVRDEEDGWGWMGAEAHLEQDHKHSEAQIQTLTLRIKELEEEQSTLNEKLNASKIKCVKLVKKIKDIEALQEQSKSERNVGFSDLDFAVQEELRSQLDGLEAKNKELIAELNTLKLERDHLNKKVDVLTSANDQLIEMKERQDIEVQMWQKRSAELKNEVQGLQWSIEEMKSEIPSLGKGEGELTEKLNALAAENEKLQNIICNLKDGRPVGSPDVAVELSVLKDEIQKLKDIRIREKESFENEIRKANEELDSMEQQFDVLSKDNQRLNEQLLNSNQEVAKLNEQIQILSESNKQFQEKLSSQNNSSDIESRLEFLTNENITLKNQISTLTEISNELASLKLHAEQLSKENSELKNQIEANEKSKEDISKFLEQIQKLGIENADLKEKLSLTQSAQLSQEQINHFDSLQQKFDYVSAELNILKNEYQKVSEINQQLKKEISVTKESSNLEVRMQAENLEKAESNLKNLDNDLKLAMHELTEIDLLIEEIINKLQILKHSNNKVDKLKQISLSIDTTLAENSRLTNEIENLKDQLSANQGGSTSVQFGPMPPVFKGFSSFTNDPFDNLQSSQNNLETEKLRTEIIQLKSVVNTYELELARLNSERVTNEQIILDLKTEISAMNEHVAKLNLQRNYQGEDNKQKLERADSEIARWREEANNLRREINNLIEKHAHELEDLRRSDAGSKEKLTEIEENYQNTMLNKDQESGYLKQILSEKEQLLANAINERNALHTQFEAVSQQIFSLENRVRDLIQENEELQGALNRSRGEENTVIEKQKEEIQELMAKLEYISQTQNARNAESENEILLKVQLKEMSDKVSFLESSNTDLQARLISQLEEISRLQHTITDLDNKRIYLEGIISEKQKEIESMHIQAPQVQDSIPSSSNEVEKLSALIKEKDLEISRVTKVLHTTQEKLVQVQDLKPINKILSLQSKLDQALSIVHARDVRCAELTQEIMQLLGERDALQLRLSEALRENEILKNDTSGSSPAPSPEMKDKLGELHRGYNKDPVVQLEMESRHNQQMDLYAEKEKDAMNTTVDYGIFNWFFSSPSQSSQQS